MNKLLIAFLFLLAAGLGLNVPTSIQAQTSPSAVYYLISKTGDGTESNPIRNRYADDLDKLSDDNGYRFSVMRKLDDPSSYTTGVGVYAIIGAPKEVTDFLDSQLNAFRLGGSLDEAVATFKQQEASNTRIQLWRDKYTDSDLDAIFQIRTSPLKPPPGTDITTWNDADTTAWTALTANPLTYLLLTGTGSHNTFDVLSNQGQLTPLSGGAFYTDTELHYSTTDNAEDQTVEVTHVATAQDSNNFHMLAGRVVVGDTDTFFAGRNQDIGGNDTRLNEVVDGTFSEIASSTQIRIAPSRHLKMYIATNGASTDIDFAIWASSGSEPGTPQIQFSGAVNAALQGASGYVGLWTTASRGTNIPAFDDLTFTNDDTPPPAGRRRILRTN